jgi:hypothetical protein
VEDGTMHKLTILLISLFALSSTCSAQLSGPLSGTFDPGEYTVVGDISVQAGDSLTLQPGTTFRFQGALNLSFDVYGYLYAAGTETDSIRFLPDLPGDTWTGIDFNDSSDDSNTLDYCLISGSTQSGVDCFSSGPAISNCTIRDNNANFGGGIYATGANPIITNCTISGNTTNVCGAGIWASSSDVIIASCTVTGNNAGNSAGGIYCYSSDAIILDCEISGNTSIAGAGGINCRYASQTITNCVISNNTTETVGGGILSNDATTTIERCLIDGNYAGIAGGGIEVYYSSTTVTNCTISGNTAVGLGGGIESFASSPIILNTIIEGNYGDGGIYFFNGLFAEVGYCDFHDNEGGNITGYTPPDLGMIVGVNTNGDSCDTYFNIFSDPLFYGVPGDSTFQLTVDSPCIDAGDPGSALDPDGTIADIGKFYFDQGTASSTAIDLTPHDPPIIIPTSGGTFNYTAEVSNSGVTPQTVDVWVMVTLPTGEQIGPLLGPVTLTLPAGFSLIRERTQDVPSNAPPGLYEYEGCLGIYPDLITDINSFYFIKSSTAAGCFIGSWSNGGQDFDVRGQIDGNIIPGRVALIEIYPNPFNLETTITFSLPEGSTTDRMTFRAAS